MKQSSASECVLISMLVARHAALNELKLNSANVEEGVLLSRLVAYCSKLVGLLASLSYRSLLTLAELVD